MATTSHKRQSTVFAHFTTYMASLLDLKQFVYQNIFFQVIFGDEFFTFDLIMLFK